MLPNSFVAQQQWLDFKNVSGQTVPPFGVMRVTDVVPPSAPDGESETTYFKCDIPNTYGAQHSHFVNGHCTVEDGNLNMCTRSGIFVALYDDSDGTPAYGDVWGPRSGTFKLKKKTGGFFCLGAPTNTDKTIAMFTAMPMDHFYGKNSTGAQIAKGASGLIDIFFGPAGSEANTGVQMPNVVARFGAIAIGALVEVFYNKMCDAGTTPNWFAMETDTCPT